ncbi:MAG: rod shape-determining protein MreC [Candidatus Zixiibacteriota bacterium]|nr:MAG: rod shape-determining protein MreC [candidate division Zixibacteria bacterium]
MNGFLARLNLENLEPWIALVVAVVISLALMGTSDTQGTELARLRTTEILEVFARPFSLIPTVMNLQAENTRLRKDNTALRIQISQAREAVQENERLRRLLDYKDSTGLFLQAGEIIGRNPLPGVHSLLINVGSAAGIAKHMAVVNDRGLVGQVVRVNAGSAVVQILMDRNMGSAVRLSGCRADGITVWGGGQRLMIDGIPNSVPVRLGEEVITSGLDGVFPEGIPVGMVVRTERSSEKLFQLIEVEPAVDFTAIEEIFIVWDTKRRPAP